MEISKEIAGRFAEIRQTQRLTQAKFSEALKIDRSTISGLENGTAPLTEKNINLVCLAFGVNEAWLRTGNGEMFNKPPEPPNPEDDDERKLLGLFRRLSAEMKAIVLRKVQKLVAVDSEDWGPKEDAEKREKSG